MMRTILFLHFHTESGHLNELIKQIPYAQEDTELYFIDISRREKETLGVDHLEYLNNHYEDDMPYVWNGQPAHIASVDQSPANMRLILLNAMRQNCRNRLNKNKFLAGENELEGRMQLFCKRPEFELISRGCNTYAVSCDLFGVRHWFGLRTSRPEPEQIHQMIRKIYLDQKFKFQQEIQQDAKLLDVLNSAIEDAEDKNPID